VEELSSELAMRSNAITKKDVYEWFVYLDELQASNVTNMMDAGPYLQAHVAKEYFNISRSIAKKVVLFWMLSLQDFTRQLWLEASEDVKYSDEP
jgi:hypothetical protein